MISLANKSREKTIIAFLKSNDLHKYKLRKIKQDASSRKYYRIESKNLLLMDSISKENKNEEFIKISQYLNNFNFSAPKVILKNHNKGLYIIEDFGMLTFRNAIKNNIDEKTLYLNAIRMLVKLHNCNTLPNVPKYNFNSLLKELNIFTDWYFKEINYKLNDNAIIKWNELWRKALKNIYENNNILVLRDFHADNLFWLPKKNKYQKIGVIDFQDAVIGNITYDISSLLEDVRRKVSPNTKKAALEEFIKLKNINDIDSFYKNYFIITAQRNAKIAGIFVRLARRDKKIKYLKLVNNAMNIFIRSLIKANQNELLDWIDLNVPTKKLNLMANKNGK